MRKPLAECTPAELRRFAKVGLGLDGIESYNTRAQLIAKIQLAQPDITEIEVEAEAPPNPAADQARANAADHSAEPAVAPEITVPKGLSPKQAAAHHHDPRIEVRIPSSRDPGGDRDVQVAVNGVVCLIKRNHWVPIPYRFFLALENAVETVMDPVNDDLGRLSVEKRNVHAYEFSSRNGPSQAEIDAWMERTQGVELA